MAWMLATPEQSCLMPHAIFVFVLPNQLEAQPFVEESGWIGLEYGELNGNLCASGVCKEFLEQRASGTTSL